MEFAKQSGEEVNDIVALMIHDDVLLMSPEPKVKGLVPVIKEVLAAKGWSLQETKSASWCPDDMDPDEQLDDIIPQFLDGIMKLGTAMEGQYMTFLGPGALSAEPVRE